MRKVDLVVRLTLGLIMLVFGLNKLYLFIPVPEQNKEGQVLISAIIESGYLIQFIALVEIAAGLLLIFGRQVTAALLLLLPVTANILLFHAFADKQNLLAGLLVFGLNMYLLYTRRHRYQALLD